MIDTIWYNPEYNLMGYVGWTVDKNQYAFHITTPFKYRRKYNYVKFEGFCLTKKEIKDSNFIYIGDLK